MMVVINPVIGWLGYADRIEFNTYSESLGMDVAEGDDEMYVRAMEEVVERFISDNCNADAGGAYSHRGGLGDRQHGDIHTV